LIVPIKQAPKDHRFNGVAIELRFGLWVTYNSEQLTGEYNHVSSAAPTSYSPAASAASPSSPASSSSNIVVK